MSTQTNTNDLNIHIGQTNSNAAEFSHQHKVPARVLFEAVAMHNRAKLVLRKPELLDDNFDPEASSKTIPNDRFIGRTDIELLTLNLNMLEIVESLNHKAKSKKIFSLFPSSQTTAYWDVSQKLEDCRRRLFESTQPSVPLIRL